MRLPARLHVRLIRRFVLSITLTAEKPWQHESAENGSTNMKRLLILSALGLYVVTPALLGLYLVAHGVGGVAPQSALADCNGSGC